MRGTRVAWCVIGCWAGVAMAAPPLPLRVLLFGHSAGFVHTGVADMQELLPPLGQQTGLFEATVSNDCGIITAAGLEPFQVLVFYTSGNLPLDDEQRKALLAFIANGGGVLGIHSATDSNYNWPEWGELIGGYFDAHPWHQPVRIKVEDPDHPAAEGLGAEWEITDEIYQHRNWSRDRVHVVLSLDPTSVDLNAPNVHRTDRDFGIAWCREYGKGRVFYHALGHRREVWENPDFQRQLLGAIKWLARADWRSDPEIQTLLERKDLDGLAALVNGRTEALRGEPVAAIASLGTTEAAAKLAAMTGADQLMDVRLHAIKALGSMKVGGIEPLVALLNDDSAMVKAAAVRAIGRRGGAEAEAVLIRSLESTNTRVRAAAVEGLGSLGTPAARDALLKVLRGDDDRLHRAALRGLPRDDPQVSAALTQLLAARDAGHQAILPEVAARLAPLAAQDAVFAALRDAVEHGDNRLKAAAVRAIAESGRPDLGSVMLPWLFAADDDVARTAAAQLARMPNLDLSDHLSPFVPTWLVCGPFPSPNGRGGHNQVFGPETEISFDSAYPGLGGEAKWTLAESRGDGVLDLGRCYPDRNQNVAAYAYTVIRVDEPIDCQLRLGSDDGCKVWLNGELLINQDVPRGLAIDVDRVPVHLNAGANTLLVKVLQGMGGWELAVRLGRAEGGMKQIRFEVDRGRYETPYVGRWLVLAPFANDQRAAHEAVLPPEQTLDFRAEVDGFGGKIGWRPADAVDGVLDFRPLCPGRPDNAAGYAYTTIVAPQDLEAELRIGTDDGCKVWLNGELLINKDVDRGLTRDEDRVRVRLKQGENRLLVKVLQQGGDWSLCARLGAVGASLDGVRFELPQ